MHAEYHDLDALLAPHGLSAARYLRRRDAKCLIARLEAGSRYDARQGPLQRSYRIWVCEAVAQHALAWARSTRPTTRGCVYLARLGDLVKVGKSRSPAARLRGMQLPGDAVLLAAVEVRDALATERRLHVMFAAQRRRGEWFELTDEDVARGVAEILAGGGV